jgi:D-glycero-D-manno-heptose 1,7-bisphosphate phosphatase
MRLRKAVFLDRDGVLNEPSVRNGKPYPPADMMSLIVLPEVRSACTALKQAGYTLVMVTNQPDVRRGVRNRDTVEAMNQYIARELSLDSVRVCWHDDNECECRKPKPGMLLDAAAELSIDLASSFMVGDRWRDTEAGRNAGCRTVFVDRGYNERQPSDYDWRVADLPAAVARILKEPQ